MIRPQTGGHDRLVGQGSGVARRPDGRRRCRPSWEPPGCAGRQAAARGRVIAAPRRDAARASSAARGRPRHEDDRADDVDLDRDAAQLRPVDVERERLRLPGREARDDVVVDRQAERQQGGGHDARQDEREGHLPEGRPLVGAEVHRRLLEVAREALQAGLHGHDHEADVEHDVGDEDRPDAQRVDDALRDERQLGPRR